MERLTLSSNRKIWVHEKRYCFGPPCCIHAPSEHRLNMAPLHWRYDRQIMERICPHGIGHPDPDDHKIQLGLDDGVHGCDGCC
jgi:hypothetical protein